MDGQCSMLDTVGNDMVFGATGSRNSYRVLGLDPGIGSCGIALIDFGLEEVVYLGVHLWDVPQEPKTHTSTAVTRRNARSARRNIEIAVTRAYRIGIAAFESESIKHFWSVRLQETQGALNHHPYVFNHCDDGKLTLTANGQGGVYVKARAFAGGETGMAVIEQTHGNITLVKKDDTVVFEAVPSYDSAISKMTGRQIGRASCRERV